MKYESTTRDERDSRRPWTLMDFPVAAHWWEELAPSAKALIAYLAARPDTWCGADDVATAIGTNVPGLLGVTAWPTKRATKLGLTLPFVVAAGRFRMKRDIAELFTIIAEEAPEELTK